MKKIILSLAIAFIALASCKKEKGVDTFIHELSTEETQITIPNAGALESVNQALVTSSNNAYYVGGELEYSTNGQPVAKVNFGNGEENSIATLEQDGVTSNLELNKEEVWYDGKKSKYKKVIVEPLIKSDDCNYIISGVIMYFFYDTGEWAATIDFGDRTCDDIAVKTKPNGEVIPFSITTWFAKL